jgi:hypothetical protein
MPGLGKSVILFGKPMAFQKPSAGGIRHQTIGEDLGVNSVCGYVFIQN